MATSSVGSSIVSLASSFDANALVTQLMAAEQRPLTLLARQRSAATGEISAWGKLKSALSSLQSTASSLNTAASFNPFSASVSNASVATASASAGAAAGTASLEVLGLAQRHTLYSSTFASSSNAVGTGSLTIQFGTYSGGTFTANGARASMTVAIGAGQNSLAGVRDAINAAGGGVTASVVNDTSGARLVLTSANSGAADSLRVTVSDDDGISTDASGLSQLAYDPAAAVGAGRNLTQSAAAQDASFKLNGLTLASASNTVSGVLDGVTLNLTGTNVGSPTTVTVARDASATVASVQKFVSAYNDAAKTLKDLTAYDTSGKANGALQGEYAATGALSQLRSLLAGSVSALAGTYGSLSSIGVTFQRDGTLSLDQAKLATALSASDSGVSRVFTATGKSDSAGLRYDGHTSATTAGTHAVSVTQAASRGSLQGSAAAGLSITAGVNDALTLVVDGTSASVTLTAGTYASTSALATELQAKLNNAAALSSAGISVAVAESAGVLTVTSARWGSASTVTGAAGNAATGLFGGSPSATAGQNIAGTIGGVAAAGDGRFLTAGSGSAAAGLRVEVTSTGTGAAGSMNFTRGYADRLASTLETLLASTGSIQGRVDTLNAQVKTIDNRTTAEQDRLASVEKRYRAQFVALATMLSRMGSTSSFLTAQLANLPGSTNSG